MKNLIILSALLFVFEGSWAQEKKAETIYSFTKEILSFDYYAEQHELWKKELQKNKKSEEAWVNFYAATRYAERMSDSTNKAEWLEKENQVVEDMVKQIPKTFTYYHILSWHNPIWNASSKEEKDKLMGYALKAHAIDPNCSDIYPELMNIHEVHKPNKVKLAEVAKKWKASVEFTPQTMAMAYNMLLSTKKNALLITAGDNDTYPLWIAQQADGFRKDVTVLNMYLALDDEYRNRKFSELDLPKMEGKVTPQLLVEHLIENMGARPLYFTSRGVLNEGTEALNHLYNIGLIYQYSASKMDNVSLVVHNFENVLLTDHLKYNFYESKWSSLDLRMANSYVPGLLLLYQHYELVGKEEEAQKSLKMIKYIAQHFDYYQSIVKQLGLE